MRVSAIHHSGGEQRQGDTDADHQRHQLRLEVVIHGHQAGAEHRRHRHLEDRHLQHRIGEPSEHDTQSEDSCRSEQEAHPEADGEHLGTATPIHGVAAANSQSARTVTPCTLRTAAAGRARVIT